VFAVYVLLKVKNIYIPSRQTKATIKTHKTKYKTVTGNKETEMTVQHESICEIRCSGRVKRFLLRMRHPS